MAKSKKLYGKVVNFFKDAESGERISPDSVLELDSERLERLVKANCVEEITKKEFDSFAKEVEVQAEEELEEEVQEELEEEAEEEQTEDESEEDSL